MSRENISPTAGVSVASSPTQLNWVCYGRQVNPLLKTGNNIIQAFARHSNNVALRKHFADVRTAPSTSKILPALPKPNAPRTIQLVASSSFLIWSARKPTLSAFSFLVERLQGFGIWSQDNQQPGIVRTVFVFLNLKVR
jgi:hypothetical protein